MKNPQIKSSQDLLNELDELLTRDLEFASKQLEDLKKQSIFENNSNDILSSDDFSKFQTDSESSINEAELY